jgi:hypothetical protein
MAPSDTTTLTINTRRSGKVAYVTLRTDIENFKIQHKEVLDAFRAIRDLNLYKQILDEAIDNA